MKGDADRDLVGITMGALIASLPPGEGEGGGRPRQRKLYKIYISGALLSLPRGLRPLHGGLRLSFYSSPATERVNMPPEPHQANQPRHSEQR